MRILFVAMPDSPHTARWISQIAAKGWDLHLFASAEGPPHSLLRNIKVYRYSFRRPRGLDPSVRLRGRWPFLTYSGHMVHVGRELFPRLFDASRWLARLVKRLKPDLIHSLEIQHAGYLTLEARRRLGSRPFPPWFLSNWGSDIALYGHLPDHEQKIRSALALADYYSCECQRDVELARQFGFKGEVLGVIPNAGGLDLKHIETLRPSIPPSKRRMIVLKGYQHFAGRALVGLNALERCASLLDGYSITVLNPTEDVKLAGALLQSRTGIPVEWMSKGPHDDVLRLQGRARTSIGLSIGDGISTSMLEAMAMGSFPIQSSTSCAHEWFRPCESGLLVPPEDPEAVARALHRVLTDDDLVDEGAAMNWRIVEERLSYEKIQAQAISLYESIFSRAPRE